MAVMVVFAIGFVAGFGVACWLAVIKIEELERQLDVAQRRAVRPIF